MDKREIFKKIREIEIKSNIVANEIFAGTYRSYFKGNGMEFSDIRRYSIGDDVKKIDWKVTARQRKAYVKEFVEERELSIFLLVDISSSNIFGRQKDKIAELIATLCFSANKNNDKVGALFFSDKIERFHQLKKGRKHSLAILDNFLKFDDNNKKTDISNALDFFNKIIKRRAIIFIISDFYDNGYEKNLKLLDQKHDLITVCIRDISKQTLPKGAIFTIIDSETGEEVVVDNLKNELKIGEDFNVKNSINLSLEDDYTKKFIRFFKLRGKKKKKN